MPDTRIDRRTAAFEADALPMELPHPVLLMMPPYRHRKSNEGGACSLEVKVVCVYDLVILSLAHVYSTLNGLVILSLAHVTYDKPSSACSWSSVFYPRNFMNMSAIFLTGH